MLSWNFDFRNLCFWQFFLARFCLLRGCRRCWGAGLLFLHLYFLRLGPNLCMISFQYNCFSPHAMLILNLENLVLEPQQFHSACFFHLLMAKMNFCFTQIHKYDSDPFFMSANLYMIETKRSRICCLKIHQFFRYNYLRGLEYRICSKK